jgi:hypothetical protein
MKIIFFLAGHPATSFRFWPEYEVRGLALRIEFLIKILVFYQSVT